LAPTLPLLITGVGAQGGDAVATVRAEWRGRLDAPGQPGQTTGPIIVNSSRAILYAGQGPDFGRAARQAAEHTRTALNGARAG
jgi:orotidine-5'-phosphate decarboxylase